MQFFTRIGFETKAHCPFVLTTKPSHRFWFVALLIFAQHFAVFAKTTKPIYPPTLPPCTDLFISEYLEGSSNNKCVEIYNPTNAAVSLTGYQIRLFFNGSTTAGSTINLTGTIPAMGTHVLCNSASSAAILALANQTSGSVTFNGDDAVALFGPGAVVLDVIGQIGVDPGTAWTSGAVSTADNTLRRKATVQEGDPDGSNAFDPSIEWDAAGIDNSSNLGMHSTSCGAATCDLTASGLSNILCNNNGTPADATDDYITFSLNPVGTGLATTYTLGAGFTPASASYGVATVFSSVAGTAGAGDLSITISDADDVACTLAETVADPGTCVTAPGCVLTASGLSNILCNDNGTPADATDDFITFSLNPVGSDISNSYSLGAGYTPALAPYGLVTIFSSASGTAGAGNLNITIADSDNSACTLAETVLDPGACSVVPPAGCNALFISEYLEGSSNNKCVEIYNPTNAAISLTGYQIRLYFNGSATAGSTINLTGTIPAFGTHVLCNSASSAAILALANQTSGSVTFNGDDAVALVGPGVVTLDVIGQIGVDPGTAWTNGGVSTADNTLRRKFGVQTGDSDGTNVFDPSIEWDAAGIDNISNLGAHLSSCGAVACDLTSSGLSNILCNNNGTPVDATDDFITFSLNPVGTGLATTYTLGASFSPATASYGVATVFSSAAGTAGGGDLSITITDSGDAACTLAETVADPGTCSNNCSITSAVVIATVCSNSGTSSNPNDDFISFTLLVNGTNTAATFTISGTSVSPSSGTFGVNSTFNTTPGTAGFGDLNLQVVDANNPTCTFDFLLEDPGSCSPECSILTTGLSNITCDDNGTPLDVTDDLVIFSLNPTGSNIGINYSVTDPSGNQFTPDGGNYGVSTTFTTGIGYAGSGDVAIVIIDANNSSCVLNAFVPDPGTCSVPVSGCTDLYFSEYLEGSGNNKCLEIYNPTGSAVNLSGYSVQVYANGSATATSNIPLSGSIAPYDVYVLCNNNSSPDIAALADLLSGSVNFNGDDAVSLTGSSGILDVIGQIGFDPGLAWTGSGISTFDFTLQRKFPVEIGDADGSNAFDPSAEWNGLPINTITGLGFHLSSCQSCLISAANISGITCSDNGTTLDPSDDVISFSLNPTGLFLSDNYTLGAGFTPVLASYGVTTVFTASAGTAGAGNLSITITDEMSPTCTLDATVTDPGSCSNNCTIFTPQVSNVQCNNNGTPANPSDDFLTFRLLVQGSNVSGSYLLSGAAVTPNTGTYGDTLTFTAPASGGNLFLSITDSGNSSCTTTRTITNPGTCSPDCSIPILNLSNVVCNNNGTAANPADDYITFDLAPFAYNASAGYIVNGAVVTPTGADYNVITTFRTADGTAGSTNFNISVTDATNPSCISASILLNNPGTCSASCTELFFSEYVEGSGNNKCLEIYNPTSAPVSLTGYQVRMFFNGSPTAGATINLTGTIPAGDVFVLCNSGSTLDLQALADQLNGNVTFNGNDAVALVKNGAIIDVIGQIGNNPGTAWTGGSASTLDQTLRRQFGIEKGDPNGANSFDPSLEWENFAINNTDGLGNHAASCTPCNLSSVGLTNVLCNNNGTSRDSTDDYITFILKPVGVGTSTTYALSGGMVSPLDTLYNVAALFATLPGTAGMGNLNLTISDVIFPSCMLNFEVIDPGVCLECDAMITLVNPTAETCPGRADGTITITANSSFPPLEYSIDGVNYQADNIFTNVSAGTYTVYARENQFTFCQDSVTDVVVTPGLDFQAPNLECMVVNVIDLPLTGTVTFDAADFIITLNDNCTDSIDIVLSPATFTYTCANAGSFFFENITATDENGLTASCFVLVEINPLPQCTPEISIQDPCVCKNNATTLDNGQFDETILVTSLSGQTWTVTAASGLYQVSSPAPPAAPLAITVGTVLTETPAGSGNYLLNGVHIDAIGYSLTVENGLGQTLSVSNECAYPNPSFDLGGTVFCVSSVVRPLVGDPGDDNIVSEQFFIDGIPATIFDVSTLSLGNHIITYTVDGGTPKALDPSDPGCIQSVSLEILVEETVSTIICNNGVQISLDATCQTTVHPDQILEGTYTCFDDYSVNITLPNGTSIGNVVTGANIGQNLTATVTHLPSGNSCWGMVTVEDKLAPVLTCTDVIVSCATPNYTPNGLASLGIPGAFAVISEGCGLADTGFSDVSETDWACGNTFSYSIVREWSATDLSGNVGTCRQSIHFTPIALADVLPPADVTVSCVNAQTSPSSTGAPFALVNGSPVQILSGTGFCELSVLFNDQEIPVCDGTTKILRKWTLVDWCSPFVAGVNPIEFTQLIKISDQTGPVVSCPPTSMVVSTNPFDCERDLDLPDVMIEDACSRIQSVKAQYQVNGINQVLNGTLADFPGNNYWTPDTLGVLGIANNLPEGLTQVTYTVKDDCGNETQCLFFVTVEDQTRPIAICDQHTVVSLGVDGNALVPAASFDDGSYDNCGEVFFKVRRMDFHSCPGYPNFFFDDVVPFCCDDLGKTITVVFRVYDVDPGPGATFTGFFEKNSNDCMVQVVVQDKIRPACIAPANVTVDCEAFDPSLWAYGVANPFDNCCLDPTKNYNGVTGIEHSANYAQFDTTCNRGRILRTFKATDCTGLTSTCTQSVTVNYRQDYYLKFPDDVRVTACNGTGVYGQPILYDEDCELIGISYTDEIFTVVPDACYQIERTWKVTNWCTYDSDEACEIVLRNPAGTGPRLSPFAPNSGHPHAATNDTYYNQYLGLLDANSQMTANCFIYKQIIKIVDTQKPVASVTEPVCDKSNNDVNLFNNMAFYDANIESHDLCEGPADLSITATDLCSGANVSVRYLLFLDLNGDGDMETVVNSLNPPAAATIHIGNAANPNFSGGTPVVFDGRAVPADRKYRFGLKQTTSGNSVTASVAWKEVRDYVNLAAGVVPELPYGTHKIKWIVEDGCGNELVQEFSFTISDCKKPTVVCKNGLSTNLMNVPAANVTLWASDFLLYGEDNCTPSDLLTFGICVVNNPSVNDACSGSLPLNPNGTPDTSVTFSCAHVGASVTVQVWAQDKAGNEDFCEATISVQDNMGVCTQTAMGTVAGALETDKNGLKDGLDDANVDLNGTAPNAAPINLSTATDVQGKYGFYNNIPLNGAYIITPEKDDDHRNGIDVNDMLLIQKHILGSQRITNPYKLIAADVNKSGDITALDIVDLRKLLLGYYDLTGFPTNTSWRFVDRSFVFTNPLQPFASAFPEQIAIQQLQQATTDGMFEAIKIGDIDNTAFLSPLRAVEDRFANTSYLEIADHTHSTAELFAVDFKTNESLRGFQMTLNTEGLEIVEIRPGTGMDLSNFAAYNAKEALAVVADKGGLDFSVTFRAKSAGKLSENLRISNRVTKALAIANDGSRNDMALRFLGQQSNSVEGLGFELYQNTPNPVTNRTSIGFYLPEAGAATLTIFDEIGRIVYRRSGDFAKGNNAFVLEKAQLAQASGMLLYQVTTDKNSATKQMLIVK